jgi:hypothetical protein
MSDLFSMLPPTPLPPFHRSAARTTYGTVTGSGNVSLANEVSILRQTALNPLDSSLPYELVMPSGTFNGQRHQFLVAGDLAYTTTRFVVTGAFVNFNALFFNTIAHSAWVMWDGAGWHVIGGNVADDDYDPIGGGGGDGGDGGDDLTGRMVRIKDGKLQLKSPDTLLWYDATPRNDGGAIVLSMEGPGEVCT